MSRAERIAQIISESPFNQNELAKSCGVSPGAVTQWKNGDTKNLRLDSFIKLCEKTQTSPVWLAIGKGEKKWVQEPPAKKLSEENGHESLFSSPQAIALTATIHEMDISGELSPEQMILLDSLLQSFRKTKRLVSPPDDFDRLRGNLDGKV